MMNSRKNTHNKTRKTSRRTYYHRRERHFLPFFSLSFLKRGHRWPWLLGSLLIIVAYIWMFYYFFVGPTGFRWRALYGDANYPEGYEIHGIDISHYQAKINWDRLRSNALIDGQPLSFVFIKSTEGSSRIDPNFNDNFDQARKYGFIRGAYHFWTTSSSARAQAYYFLNKVHLEKGDLPPVLDIEHKPKDQSVEDFQTDVLTWLHIVEDKYGVKPIIYTYYKFKENYLNAPVFDDYPYWIAHYYVSEVKYKGKWNFWQHTDAGSLPGIKGNVDLNIFNGTYYDLLGMTIGAKKEIEIAE
jgi:lysozyme